MSSVDDAIAKAVKTKVTIDDTLINDPAQVDLTGYIDTAPQAFTKPAEPVFVKVYDVQNDGILGSNTQPGDGITILKGRVSDMDLEAAAVDKEWLLKLGVLVEAGYAPTS